MNNYLFFRTDRIGDFLVSAILIKSIKRNNQNSYIIVISSESNYYYIKSFSFFDEVILYPKNYLKKIVVVDGDTFEDNPLTVAYIKQQEQLIKKK